MDFLIPRSRTPLMSYRTNLHFRAILKRKIVRAGNYSATPRAALLLYCFMTWDIFITLLQAPRVMFLQLCRLITRAAACRASELASRRSNCVINYLHTAPRRLAFDTVLHTKSRLQLLKKWARKAFLLCAFFIKEIYGHFIRKDTPCAVSNL